MENVIDDSPKERECPPSLHDFVPIMEADMTVGLVCTICHKLVHENRELSGMVVTASGIVKPSRSGLRR
jgi:hypothetical protein